MSQDKYQVIVSGRLVEGVDLDTAKSQVAQLFGCHVSKIEMLFSDQFVVVKKGLDEARAKKYMQALKHAGLVSTAQLMQDTIPSGIGLAPPGDILDKTPPVLPSNIKTSHISAAKVGETLVPSTPVPKPDIDTRGLVMAQAGAELDRSPLPDAADIDIAGIDMAEVGVELDNKPKPLAPEIDTSDLTVATAGEVIIEHKPVPKANIDTSKLVLEE